MNTSFFVEQITDAKHKWKTVFCWGANEMCEQKSHNLGDMENIPR